MDDMVVAKHLENLDHRLARVEQILPTLATTDDLRRGIAEAVAPLATKDDLKALATKDDLKALASKGDLKALATKDELTGLATKDELKALATTEALHTIEATLRQEIREEGDRSRRYMDIVGESLRGDIQLIAEHLASVMPKGTGS